MSRTSSRRQRRATRRCGRIYKNHIDGVNLLPHLTGKRRRVRASGFFYISDDGDILALRFDNWKMVFMEQRCQGTHAGLGRAIHAPPCAQDLYNLRTDPYEFADVTSNAYYDWLTLPRCILLMASRSLAAQFAATFKDFPIVQKPNTFTIDDAIGEDERGRGVAPSH